jgi:outer membrane receptor protein involved in Fe transport
MTNPRVFRAYSILAALTLLAGTAAAQSGSILGTVTAAEGRGALLGARVSIVAPERITMTDERGAYVLRDVPPGDYVVHFSAIGKKPDSTRATVRASNETKIDFALKEGSLLLSSVVVSATRTPVEATKLAATVNVLTPEQVRQSPSRESQDMLREFTSVELPRMSSLVGGTAQIVSIRGVDEGRTVVLTDGFPINDAWGEWIDWGRTPKAMLDHVEVVEGGTSSLYGNGAMGGLISFFSRPLAPGAMDVQIDGGSRGAQHGYVAMGLPILSALTANVFGDFQDKGGYKLLGEGAGPIDNIESRVTQRNGFARLNLAPNANWSAFATAHAFGDSRGTGTPLAFANRDQRDANFGLDIGTYQSGQLSLRGFDGRQIENQRSTSPRTVSGVLRAAEDSTGRATIPSHDWGASAVWSRSGIVGLEAFSIGGDFRHYQGDYNEIQYSNAGCPATPTCGPETLRLSSGGAQSLSGAFIQAVLSPTEKLNVQLSARVDRWDNTDGHSVTIPIGGAAQAVAYGDSSKSAFSPRVGVKYQLSPTLAFHAAYYRAFRAPNLAELYRKRVSQTQITLPNPFLKSENAEGREVGFDYQPKDWFQAKGTWYVADYNNFNVPTALTGTARPAECGTITTCSTRLNVSRSRSTGGEVYVALHPIDQFYLSSGITYDDARQQSGLTSNIKDDNKPHINRVPSPRQTIRATWTSPAIGDWTAIWRHEGHTTTLQGVWLDPFTVVDANVQREVFPGFRGFVWVDNVFDANYQVNLALATATTPRMVTVGMPRTIRVGVEAYRF